MTEDNSRRSSPWNKVIFGVVAVIAFAVAIKVVGSKRHDPSKDKGSEKVTAASVVTPGKDSGKPDAKADAKPAAPAKDEPKPSVAANVEPPSAPLVPSGDGAATIVPLADGGKNPPAVQYVEFEIVGVAFKTPPRTPVKADAPAIPVTFVLNEASPQRVLRGDLAQPKAATALKLTIVDPRHPGWSYRGKVTIHLAGAPAYAVAQPVELDIVKAAPAGK